MSAVRTLKRADLDRLYVTAEAQGLMPLVCIQHPEDGVNAFYEDGRMRLLCKNCGFELVRIKVAE